MNFVSFFRVSFPIIIRWIRKRLFSVRIPDQTSLHKDFKFMNMNTNQTKLHTLGIDIGSTTVKVAILNEKSELLFSDYERHYANIQETLSALLKKSI